jgi:hypothetical protein
MKDTPPDNLPDNEAMRWVSFAELAAARGVDKASAIRLVRRRGWRRQRDNQGHVRALVPETWLSSPEDRLPDSPGDNPPDTLPGLSVHTRALATLEEAVTGLTRRAEQAEARADAALAVADRTLVQLSEATARIEAADQRAGRLERDLAAALAATDTARGEARTAQDAAEALRQADEARRGKGRLRRAWDGWRGR